MDVKKVLIISQEIEPYVPTSLQAQMGYQVPKRIHEKGLEVRTFMPKYGSINERRNQLHEVIRLSGLNISINDTDHPLIIKVASLQSAHIQVYFIDNDDYFHRGAPAQLEVNSHPDDNDERIMFYVRGVFETVKKLRWVPSVVHCQGWVTALAPLYIKKIYVDDPTFQNAKVVYTVFGDDAVRTFDSQMVEKLKMEGLSDKDIESLVGQANITLSELNRLAIDYADGLVLATDDIDPEIVKYAKESGKPILENGDNAIDMIDKYHEFYTSL